MIMVSNSREKVTEGGKPPATPMGAGPGEGMRTVHKRTTRGRPPPAGWWKKTTLIEEYWVPAHSERRESRLFILNKRFLRDQCQLPCWICGAQATKANPLEVHHVFEWALWNAVDARRVTAIVEILNFYEEGYLARAGKHRQALQAALDAARGVMQSPDDIRNLVVLCQDHHRMTGTGVHTISFPVWIALSAIRKGSKLTRHDVVRAAAQLRRIDEATADILLSKRVRDAERKG
jgi:hypothetical protein